MCCNHCDKLYIAGGKDNPHCSNPLCICHQEAQVKDSWRENIQNTLKYFLNPAATKFDKLPPCIIDAIDAAYVAGMDESNGLTRKTLVKLLAKMESKNMARECRHIIKEYLLGEEK